MLNGMLVLLAAVSTGAEVKATVKDLSWFEGNWSAEVWGGTFEEYWTSSKAGSLLGVGRHFEGEKTGFMEFLSIEPDKDGTLVMYITMGSPSRDTRTTTPFKLTSLKGKVAVFENPANDFPSKITYSMKGANLFCKIEGMENGKASSQDFDFKAIKK